MMGRSFEEDPEIADMMSEGSPVTPERPSAKDDEPQISVWAAEIFGRDSLARDSKVAYDPGLDTGEGEGGRAA